MTPDPNKTAGQKPHEGPSHGGGLDLPFNGTRADLGEVVFDRRKAILITVIIYLLLGIGFFSSKIIIERREVAASVMIDIEEMEQLIREMEQEKPEPVIPEPDIYEPVRNVISNEEGEVVEGQSDRMVRSEFDEMMERADEIERQMRQSRELYEQSLLTQDDPAEDVTEQEYEDPRVQPIKVEGVVTVYYSLKNPVRKAQNLYIPAYKCRRGGRVVVDVVVNPKGQVISAVVNKSFSANNECMMTTAIEAAYASRFNVYPGAPPKQQGRVIYTFVPQNQ